MRLILNNFRCFKNLTIDFPENGTVLLWGTSGIGKTSIFKAINFVLYGKETRHVIKHGEKKCKVEFHYTDKKSCKTYYIIRTKNPSHLSITQQNESGTSVTGNNDLRKSEDDEAQEIIYKLFGKEFMLTSYMAQKSTENFFSLPNNEKSSFLQKLSIKDFDVEAIRKKTREIIRKRKDKLIAITTELKIYKEQISDNQGSSEPVLKLDLKGKTFDDFLLNEENLREKNKSSLKQLKERLNNAIIEKKNLESLFEKKNSLELSIKEKYSIKEEFQNKLNDIPYYDRDPKTGDIIQIEKLLKEKANLLNLEKLIKLQSECKKTKNEFENLLKLESDSIEENITKIKESLSKFENKILSNDQYNEYKILCENYNKCIDIFEQYFEEEEYNPIPNIPKIFRELLETLEHGLHIDKEELDTLIIKRDKLEQEVYDYKNKKSDIENTILTLSKDCDQKIKGKNLKCPSCSIFFYVENQNVIQIKDDIEGKTKQRDELKEKSKEISSLYNEKNNLLIKLNRKIDELKITVNDTKNDIEKIKNIIIDKNIPDNKSIIEKVNEYSNIKIQVDKLNKELGENVEKLKHIQDKNISHSSISKHIKIKYESFQKLKKTFEELSVEDLGSSEEIEIEQEDVIRVPGPVNDPTTKIEEIDKNISELKEYKIKRDNLLNLIDKIDLEIQNGLSLIEKLPQDINLSEENKLLLSNEISEIENKIKEKEKTSETLSRRKEKIDKYVVEIQKWNVYIKIRDKLNLLADEERLTLRGISKAETLLKMINDAETLSLLNIIENVNRELEEYILSFFGEGVLVRLEPYKEDKSGEKKNCIDVIVMKDGEKVPLDSLSGGEFDRVALGFFLAFNKVAKSDIIMLDECLASLHSELVEDIVEMIKTKLSDKLVLFTLHQANVGMFDEVIDIEKYRCCD